VSIELPNYTIQTESERPNKFKKFILPLSIIISLLVGYFASGVYSNTTIKSLRMRNDVLETVNSKNLDKIVQLETQLSMLKTEKKVKQQAVIELQNDYKELINSQDNLKSEISFYERLLSPNTGNKGLRIFELSVNNKNDLSYHLKMILVQKIERAKIISGKLEIFVVGKQNNKTKSLLISKEKDSSYKFKYFHNFSLNFSLPEGFNAQQLVVKLFPKGKKAKTIEHTVVWQSIIK
jgi:hypothetical protein